MILARTWSHTHSRCTRSPSRWRCVVVALAIAIAGCATRSGDIRAQASDPARYAGWSCAAIDEGADRVQQQAADLAYAVDEHAGNNVIALSVAVAVFWPALLAMRPVGPLAAERAQLRGHYEALQAARSAKGCAPRSELLAADEAAALPIALGERLLYEERREEPATRLRRGLPHELALKLVALRRDGLEFDASFDGRPLAAPWTQDRAGNIGLPGDAAGLVGWSRLLRRPLELGDVLSGSLQGPGGGGRVRGQVIAIGVQAATGRSFDAAVIELFGEVPHGRVSARLDGVMVVDRKSGTLLRLELKSANPDYAMRRLLTRVEPAS